MGNHRIAKVDSNHASLEEVRPLEKVEVGKRRVNRSHNLEVGSAPHVDHNFLPWGFSWYFDLLGAGEGVAGSRVVEGGGHGSYPRLQ